MDKLEKDQNRHFSKEDTQMFCGHMKRCSASSVIKEAQMKTAVVSYFLSTRPTRTKK